MVKVKLLTWLLIRGEAKNVFTKVFRLVSPEVSIYTGFTNNCIYGLSYIIICYRKYILKKSRISVLQQHRYGLNPRLRTDGGVWDPRESGIPAGREWIPDSDPGIHGSLGSLSLGSPPRECTVEDLPHKKFGIKKTDDSLTRCPGFFPGWQTVRRTRHCGGIIYR